jgi:hypothetical protein
MLDSLAAHPVQEYSLRADAPIPGAVTSSWLHFRGIELLSVEEKWNDIDTIGTHLDGEIFNRVALYGVLEVAESRSNEWVSNTASSTGRSDFTAIVAEITRYNPRRILLLPNRLKGGPNPLPLYSKAQRFSDLRQAQDWLEGDPMLGEGTIRQALDAGLERLRSDKSVNLNL